MDLKKELVVEIEVVHTKNHSDEVTINSLEGVICLVYYRVTLGTGLQQVKNLATPLTSTFLLFPTTTTFQSFPTTTTTTTTTFLLF